MEDGPDLRRAANEQIVALVDIGASERGDPGRAAEHLGDERTGRVRTAVGRDRSATGVRPSAASGRISAPAVPDLAEGGGVRSMVAAGRAETVSPAAGRDARIDDGTIVAGQVARGSTETARIEARAGAMTPRPGAGSGRVGDATRRDRECEVLAAVPRASGCRILSLPRT